MYNYSKVNEYIRSIRSDEAFRILNSIAEIKYVPGLQMITTSEIIRYLGEGILRSEIYRLLYKKNTKNKCDDAEMRSFLFTKPFSETVGSKPQNSTFSPLGNRVFSPRSALMICLHFQNRSNVSAQLREIINKHMNGEISFTPGIREAEALAKANAEFESLKQTNKMLNEKLELMISEVNRNKAMMLIKSTATMCFDGDTRKAMQIIGNKLRVVDSAFVNAEISTKLFNGVQSSRWDSVLTELNDICKGIVIDSSIVDSIRIFGTSSNANNSVSELELAAS